MPWSCRGAHPAPGSWPTGPGTLWSKSIEWWTRVGEMRTRHHAIHAGHPRHHPRHHSRHHSGHAVAHHLRVHSRNHPWHEVACGHAHRAPACTPTRLLRTSTRHAWNYLEGWKQQGSLQSGFTTDDQEVWPGTGPGGAPMGPCMCCMCDIGGVDDPGAPDADAGGR